MKKREIELYRGVNAGVFAGSNGYYAARMASDGVSHYQEPGEGWSDKVLLEQNRIARDMDRDQGQGQ